MSEKKHEQAIGALRDALTIWLDAGSRINAAHVRLRLAQILAATGETDEAELELACAERAFAQMDAEPMIERCRVVRQAMVSRRSAAR